MAAKLAVRPSRRPNSSSTTLRATWVETKRSVVEWKVPTLSAREWRSAADAALGANGSCTWRKSSSARSSRLLERARDVQRQRHRAAAPERQRLPDGEHRGAARRRPNSASGSERIALTVARPSRTSSRESDGATTTTRCPRAHSSSESRSTKRLTSWCCSQGQGVTWAIEKDTGAGYPGAAAGSARRRDLALPASDPGTTRRRDGELEAFLPLRPRAGGRRAPTTSPRCRRGPVWQPLPDALREQLLDLPLPERAATLDDLVATALRDVLPHAMGNGHPAFFGWVNPPPSPAGVVASLAAAAMNPSVVAGDHADVHLERAVGALAGRARRLPARARRRPAHERRVRRDDRLPRRRSRSRAGGRRPRRASRRPRRRPAARRLRAGRGP